MLLVAEHGEPLFFDEGESPSGSKLAMKKEDGFRAVRPATGNSELLENPVLSFAGACTQSFTMAFATQRCSITLAKVFTRKTTRYNRVAIVLSLALALAKLHELTIPEDSYFNSKDSNKNNFNKNERGTGNGGSVLCDFHMNQFMLCPHHFSSSSTTTSSSLGHFRYSSL